jgi:hypothetical protein
MHSKSCVGARSAAAQQTIYISAGRQAGGQEADTVGLGDVSLVSTARPYLPYYIYATMQRPGGDNGFSLLENRILLLMEVLHRAILAVFCGCWKALK